MLVRRIIYVHSLNFSSTNTLVRKIQILFVLKQMEHIITTVLSTVNRKLKTKTRRLQILSSL